MGHNIKDNLKDYCTHFDNSTCHFMITPQNVTTCIYHTSHISDSSKKYDMPDIHSK